MRFYPILIALFIAGGLNAPEATAQIHHVAASHDAGTRLSENQKVEQLIAHVRSMRDATFIRNGSSHTCKEAADHLQSKWQKHKDEVKTARGFIDELASKSGMTGKAYQIRFKDGRTETSAAVLNRKLKQLEK